MRLDFRKKMCDTPKPKGQKEKKGGTRDEKGRFSNRELENMVQTGDKKRPSKDLFGRFF